MAQGPGPCWATSHGDSAVSTQHPPGERGCPKTARKRGSLGSLGSIGPVRRLEGAGRKAGRGYSFPLLGPSTVTDRTRSIIVTNGPLVSVPRPESTPIASQVHFPSTLKTSPESPFIDP